MQLPYSLDVLANAHHADLLHEAATERLASQATRRPPLVRRRLAEVLYTFAARLDPCAVPASLIPAPYTRNGLPRDGGDRLAECGGVVATS